MKLTFRAVDEPVPGEKWAGLFRQYWPSYRKWWLSEGEKVRPGKQTCRVAMQQHMPELLAVYDDLVKLAGGSDQAARFLSLYSPPAYQAACSQAISTGPDALLVRNYDYHPDAFDAVILRTQWLGKRVIGVSDCLIGLLDGINEDGLVVSLTFGGRRVVGEGFGIPLVLRYVLETCKTVNQAVRVLKRIPCHMAYNVTVLDNSGCYKTVFVSPDRPAIVTSAAVATNHQREVEWNNHARASNSVEREEFLLNRLKQRGATSEQLVAAFHQPPLYSPQFNTGFGTLYTAVYSPKTKSLELRWPDSCWPMSMSDFHEEARSISFAKQL